MSLQACEMPFRVIPAAALERADLPCSSLVSHHGLCQAVIFPRGLSPAWGGGRAGPALCRAASGRQFHSGYTGHGSTAVSLQMEVVGACAATEFDSKVPSADTGPYHSLSSGLLCNQAS